MIKLNRKPNPADKPSSVASVQSPSSPPGPSRRERRFFTVKQLAARWQMSERQVHRFIQSGTLVAHKLGRSLRIAEDDILLFEWQSR